MFGAGDVLSHRVYVLLLEAPADAAGEERGEEGGAQVAGGGDREQDVVQLHKSKVKENCTVYASEKQGGAKKS